MNFEIYRYMCDMPWFLGAGAVAMNLENEAEVSVELCLNGRARDLRKRARQLRGDFSRRPNNCRRDFLGLFGKTSCSEPAKQISSDFAEFIECFRKAQGHCWRSSNTAAIEQVLWSF